MTGFWRYLRTDALAMLYAGVAIAVCFGLAQVFKRPATEFLLGWTLYAAVKAGVRLDMQEPRP